MDRFSIIGKFELSGEEVRARTSRGEAERVNGQLAKDISTSREVDTLTCEERLQVED